MCWNRLERAGKGINWLDYAFIFPKFQRFYLPLFLYIIFQSSALICSSLVLDFIHHRHYPSNPWQLYPTIPSTIYPLYSPWKKFHFILWVVFILDLNSKYNITSRQPGSAQALELKDDPWDFPIVLIQNVLEWGGILYQMSSSTWVSSRHSRKCVTLLKFKKTSWAHIFGQFFLKNFKLP